MSKLRTHIQHWKQKHKLYTLLDAKEDELQDARRALLHAQQQSHHLSARVRRLHDTALQLQGALRVKKAILMGSDDALASPSPRPLPTPAHPTETSDRSETPTAEIAPLRDAKRASAKPKRRTTSARKDTLHAYVERFLAYEEAHSTHGRHTTEARRANLLRFLDIVGYSLPLIDLSAKHLRHYRELMHGIPKNFEKRGFAIPRARSARPAWFTKTIREWQGDTLSGAGIDTHFKHVRVFLTWLRNEHYLSVDLVSLLKVSKRRSKETQKTVVNFMPEDLHKLFVDGYLYGDRKGARDQGAPWHFWVPLIALYTGMRSEEIGALRLEHLVMREGLWCIQITRSKTEAGVRTFPVPQRILDAGLLAYHQEVLESVNGDVSASLFPTLKMKGGEYSNRIGQFFNRNVNGKLKDGTPRIEGYLHKCGVNNPSETETLKFHSFRHGFITKWLETRLPLDVLKQVVGHRGDFKTYGVVYEEQEGATETYIHLDRINGDALKARLQRMKAGMDKLDFGVDLSQISFERFQSRT